MAGDVPAGWDERCLYDVAEYVNGRATKPAEVQRHGVPVIKIAELNGGISSGTDRVPETVVQEKHRVRDGDLLFAWSGTVGIYSYRGPTAALNQHIFRVVAREGIDQRFLRYLLEGQMPTFAGFVENKKTTMGHVTVRDLRLTSVAVPSSVEQRAIAHILGTLDDKIDLNRRMNETLEAMARALFKSWFVDFEPVRAKAEGRDPGLPVGVAGLFPDSFEDSELGEIPEGWEVGCVDDEFALTMGQSPPGNTYNEIGDGLPFYQGRTDFDFRFPKRRVYCTAPTRLARAGDTLISVRAPVGDINMASEECAVGRGIAAARHRDGSRSYSYYFMQGLEDVFGQFEAEGTVFGSIGKKDFHAIPCTKPARAVIAQFERLCAAFDSRIEANIGEVATLTALRDTLLPKLISGELRVPDAERFITEVA